MNLYNIRIKITPCSVSRFTVAVHQPARRRRGCRQRQRPPKRCHAQIIAGDDTVGRGLLRPTRRLPITTRAQPRVPFPPSTSSRRPLLLNMEVQRLAMHNVRSSRSRSPRPRSAETIILNSIKACAPFPERITLENVNSRKCKSSLGPQSTGSIKRRRTSGRPFTVRVPAAAPQPVQRHVPARQHHRDPLAADALAQLDRRCQRSRTRVLRHLVREPREHHDRFADLRLGDEQHVVQLLDERLHRHVVCVPSRQPLGVRVDRPTLELAFSATSCTPPALPPPERRSPARRRP